ncbi:hypothetical protein D3C75_918280 [compost metagenome]
MLIKIIDLPAKSKHRAILHLIDQGMLIHAEPDHFSGRGLKLLVPVLTAVLGVDYIHIVPVIINFAFVCNDMNTHQIVP